MFAFEYIGEVLEWIWVLPRDLCLNYALAEAVFIIEVFIYGGAIWKEGVGILAPPLSALFSLFANLRLDCLKSEPLSLTFFSFFIWGSFGMIFLRSNYSLSCFNWFWVSFDTIPLLNLTFCTAK